MSRAIMQQALNALLISAPLGHAMEDYEYRHRLIKDIEDELAKPEQEPVSHLWECIGRWSAYLAANGKQGNLAPPTWLVDAVKAATSLPRKELAKPEQEPVALKMVYGEVCCQSKHDDQSFGMWCPITEEDFPNGTKFYTAPPRKEWVGLTDDEINKIANSPQPVDETSSGYVLPFAKAIQAKLKEKNGAL
jgi:hypothetical protein